MNSAELLTRTFMKYGHIRCAVSGTAASALIARYFSISTGVGAGFGGVKDTWAQIEVNMSRGIFQTGERGSIVQSGREGRLEVLPRNHSDT